MSQHGYRDHSTVHSHHKPQVGGTSSYAVVLPKNGNSQTFEVGSGGNMMLDAPVFTMVFEPHLPPFLAIIVNE